jgi:hypothetical protein
MTSRLPPQPPPANQRLYNQQTYNGFVLTIDGHLVYSPFTDVDPSNTLPGGGGVANWAISNQGFFYNTTRGTTIDRTGVFVRIYDQATTQPIATAIILNANFAANTIQIKVIRYEFEKDVFDLDPSLVPLKLRMEDNWKFCSNIPDWIPAGAESLSRWIPIMSSELEPSLGQKLNLKGGVTSVDGLSVPLVLDTSYQDDNRLQRLFTEDAVTYQYNQNLLGLNGVDNVSENNLTVQQTLISVGSFGFPITSVPDYAGQYLTYYPFLNPSGLELALPEPWFIDTEAIIATTRTGGIVPPPPAVPTFQYGVQRAIDDTPATPHGKYSVIFRGMPFPIGQTCKLWEVNNFNDRGDQDWVISYRGMIENIALSDGLAACSIEISSITFTSRVNAGFATQTTALERRNAPGRRQKDKFFFNTFIATQPSFQDTFFWVKVGGIALPLIRIGNINYLSALNNAITQEEYWNLYGLLPNEISQRSVRDLDSGTTDVGYKIGVQDATGTPFSVAQLYRSSILQYNGPLPIVVNNWFLINQNVIDGYSDFLPNNSPWGFYILDQLSDENEHDQFVRLRQDPDLTSNSRRIRDVSADQRLAICDYLSTQPASFIHMFQNFGKGYSQSSLPDYAQAFYYTGDPSSTENTDRNNYYLLTSVIDVILQILTSTGSGTADVDVPSSSYRQIPGVNGAWDLIPREFGLGINIDEIDLDTFSKVRRERGGMDQLVVSNIYMEVGKDTPQKFLEEQILKPFFLALGTDSVGKVILVDVADITVGPNTVQIPSSSFVRKGGQRTRVTLTYDATDLSDSFTFNWKEPFRSIWSDPLFIRSLTSSGISAGAQSRQLNDGTFVTVKSKARLFQRIQASPIKYELKYAPVAGEYALEERQTVVIGVQALRYLKRFNRIVPRAKFELFWDYTSSPDIGDVVTFNLDAIPNKDGIIGDDTKTIVGKIIDIKADRKAKTAEYTAVLTDTSLAPLQIVWNLTAELTGPAIAPLTWELSAQDFCIGFNSDTDGAGEVIWEVDASQFLVGSTIIVWDLNWRYVTDTVITNVTQIVPGIFEIEVADDTGFLTGYRITLETLANSTSAFAEFQTWFGEGQKYLF